jgi:hypothetical protein
MKKEHVLAQVSALAAVLSLIGCGGSGNPHNPGTPPPTLPPAPAASIAATGVGAIVLHQSLDSRYGYALETPVKVTESGGGTASWDFVRYQIYLSGKEIERYELGSSDIAAAGYHLIAANSSKTYTILYRQNADKFDRIDITLGFSDQKDARPFTVAVPFSSFTDVTVSVTPLAVPPKGTIRLADGGTK